MRARPLIASGAVARNLIVAGGEGSSADQKLVRYSPPGGGYSVEVPKLAQRVKGFRAGDVGTVKRAAGTAVLLTWTP